MKTTAAVTLVALTFFYAPLAQADTFGSGANTFDIEFVTIGDPGNPPGPYSYGSVRYDYRIGKYEISEDMINKANALGNLGITHGGQGANKPATSVSWFQAAKFVNWLNTSTGGMPAYKFDDAGNFRIWESGDAGFDPNNQFRNRLARYVLPSSHEWFKAAYYDATAGVYYEFATGSDTLPTPVASGTAAGTAVYNVQSGPADITLAGGLSPYGTMAQCGNVIEWQEQELFVSDPFFFRPTSGGWWSDSDPLVLSAIWNFPYEPTHEEDAIGFRVASIPEPSTMLMGALAAAGLRTR